jgi:hypothetical protein
MEIFILNSPILTEFGQYNYKSISELEATEIARNGFFTSAVGHESTAKLLSCIFQLEVPSNRVSIKMKPGDIAIIFKLNTRLQEGQVLDFNELSKYDYSFGLLERVS